MSNVRHLRMRVLLVILQLVTGYLALAIALGMMQSPDFNALQIVVVGTFLAGLLLVTLFVPRFTRGAQLSPIRARRVGAIVLLCLLALGMGAVAHGVLVGIWRGPLRLVAIHQLSVQFAGAWALAMVFFLIGGLCLAFAINVLRRPDA